MLEHFAVRERPDVVDIAAGTGKLTRTLARIAGTLVAVEPDPGLRAVIERVLPDVRVLDGTAEALPLESASADVACAGQAFHWFDLDRALDEIARVLRPGGILVAGWNLPADDGSWYDVVVEYLHDRQPRTTCRRRRATGRPRSLRPAAYRGLFETESRHEQAARLRRVRAPARHAQRDQRPPAPSAGPR